MTILSTKDVYTLGYTEKYIASCHYGPTEFLILVPPDVDFDSRFKAWDIEYEEFFFIAGWLWSFHQEKECV